MSLTAVYNQKAAFKGLISHVFKPQYPTVSAAEHDLGERRELEGSGSLWLAAARV